MLNSVLKFWFEEIDPKLHFSPSPAFDAEIRARFEMMANKAAAKLLNHEHPAENTPTGSLALIILLDQFPRNMYRGTKAAFAWDPLALGLAKRAVKKGHDLRTTIERRSFYYMPFMHSENLEDQNSCVKLVDQRLEDDNTLFHAKAHRKLIKQFGRFPHRNDVLGRESETDELTYLKDGGYTP